MSLRPEPVGEIPAETARVARAAFPKGTVVTRLRDEFDALYEDEDFRSLYPARGQPGLTSWRLALVTVFQFLEHLSDRQAAEAVRARIDWKYALGLELTDSGFHFSVLAEFRARLVAGGAEPLLLDTMLERFKARGLVKARGKQRTDSTYVLAAVRDLSFLERVAETLRAALDDVAAVAPDWLRAVAKPVWFERYGRRVEDHRLPKSREEREALALEVGADGFVLLDALDAPTAPAAAREVAMVRTLRDVWRVHYARDDGGRLRWRSVAQLPPVAERVQSPYDPEAHFSQKRQFGWTGYKVHVTEACDDDAVHLITHVMSRPAMRPDMTSTAEIHEWRTIRAVDGAPRIQALFSRSDCRACSARAMCTPATSTRRHVHFHPRAEYEALNAARARMADPAWIERYRRRAGVEGTLSQGVRAFGLRRSRYIGLAKTGLQQVCTAAAINVSRVVHWLNGRPRAKTRVTRFAALAAAA